MIIESIYIKGRWDSKRNSNNKQELSGKSLKEYYKDNRDRRLEYQNQYSTQRRHVILEQTRQYNRDSKGYLKQFHIMNREQQLEYQKQYYIG